MELSAAAQWRYAQLYRDELNFDFGDGVISAVLERRAPMLLRLAMLMALTDLDTRIDVQHIEAAMAWIRYATASAQFVFASAVDEAKLDEMSQRIVERFDSQMSVFTTSALLLDDGVIDPRDTRAVLANVLAVCREEEARKPQTMQFSVARP